MRFMIPASRSFLICFSTPRDDISISILTFSDEGLPNKLTFSKKNILL